MVIMVDSISGGSLSLCIILTWPLIQSTKDPLKLYKMRSKVLKDYCTDVLVRVGRLHNVHPNIKLDEFLNRLGLAYSIHFFRTINYEWNRLVSFGMCFVIDKNN